MVPKLYKSIQTDDDHTITYKDNGEVIPVTTHKANWCPKDNTADLTA